MIAGLFGAVYLEKSSGNNELFFDKCLKALTIIGFVGLVIINY